MCIYLRPFLLLYHQSPNVPPPQVCLDHDDTCNAEETAKKRQNLVPPETIEAEHKDNIRRRTTTDLRAFDMYRLISDCFKPFQLGEPGRPKVSETPVV